MALVSPPSTPGSRGARDSAYTLSESGMRTTVLSAKGLTGGRNCLPQTHISKSGQRQKRSQEHSACPWLTDTCSSTGHPGSSRHHRTPWGRHHRGALTTVLSSTLAPCPLSPFPGHHEVTKTLWG